MRVYLGGDYSNPERMREYAAELSQIGIEVCSRWIHKPKFSDLLKQALTPTSPKPSPEEFFEMFAGLREPDRSQSQEARTFCAECVEDLNRADVLAIIPDGTTSWECGYGWAKGKTTVVITQKQSPLLFIDDQVFSAESWESAKRMLEFMFLRRHVKQGRRLKDYMNDQK